MKFGLNSITKIYPFWKGRGVLANSLFMRAKHNRKRLVALNEGMQIFVTENDYISRMIRFFGDFDPCLTRLIKSMVHAGDVVIDVGANLGVVTLPVAKWVGSKGLVCAFEPQRAVYELLKESVEFNALGNVRIFPIALSNFDGRGHMEGDDRSLGTAHLVASDFSGGSETCDVKCLDSLDLLTEGQTVRLIKIDVEGHEAQVLAGASNFIIHKKPEYILFESHPARGEFEEREEIRLLRGFGYRIFSVERSLFLRPNLREVSLIGGSEFSCSEYLAKRTES